MPGKVLIEDIRVFLYLNLILSLVPILVGVLVRNLLINVRKHREDVEALKEKVGEVDKGMAVLQTDHDNLKRDVERLRDIHNSERG